VLKLGHSTTPRCPEPTQQPPLRAISSATVCGVLASRRGSVGRLPVRTAHEALKGMAHLRKHSSEITLPLWVHHGDGDK